MSELSVKEHNAREKLCLALDQFSTMEAVLARVRELDSFVGMFKVGLGQFTLHGPAIVEAVCQQGKNIFLDLKFHDIPATIYEASRHAAHLQVYMFNIHASGGMEMMQAAVAGAKAGAAKSGNRVPKIIAVTAMTSISQEILHQELKVNESVVDYTLHLAQLAQQAGLDGIVCSALEIAMIRPHLPAGFLYVTPGIKGVTTSGGSDQKRVATPGQAVQSGSSILVIGRAINQVSSREERQQTTREILRDMAKYL